MIFVMSRRNLGCVFISLYLHSSASCFSNSPPVSDPLPAFVCFPSVGLSVFHLCPVIPTSLVCIVCVLPSLSASLSSPFVASVPAFLLPHRLISCAPNQPSVKKTVFLEILNSLWILGLRLVCLNSNKLAQNYFRTLAARKMWASNRVTATEPPRLVIKCLNCWQIFDRTESWSVQNGRRCCWLCCT